MLGALAAVRRVGWPARRDLPLLALCALSGMTAYQVLLNAGEVTVPAATASLLVNVAPIFTALLAAALLGERLTAMGWCGVALGFAGAGAHRRGRRRRRAPLGRRAARARRRGRAGDVLRLPEGAAAPLRQPRGDRVGDGSRRGDGAAAGARASRPTCSAAPTAALLAVGFLALGASALGFLTWAYAVARVDVTAAASTLYAVPPVAALVGWVALGEVPSPLTAVGGAIALAGVAHHVGARGRADHAHDELAGRPTSAGGRSRAAAPSASPPEAPAGDAPAGRARPTPA